MPKKNDLLGTGGKQLGKQAALRSKLTKASKSLFKLAEGLHWKAEALARAATSLPAGAGNAEGVAAGATPATYNIVLQCVQGSAPNIDIGPGSVLNKIPVAGDDIAPCINSNIPLRGRQKWTGAEIDAHPTWTVQDLADLTEALKHQQP